METTTRFVSADKQNTILMRIWTPDTKQPVGIVQLVHGMAEHSSRYAEFAQYLNQANYIVVCHDHLGHGGSVAPNGIYGFFGMKQPIADLIADTLHVNTVMHTHYPQLPLYIMGHSMGSFITRIFLAHYSDKVAGAIIMGTAGPRSELQLVLPIVRGLNKLYPTKVNHLLDKIAFGNYANKFDPNEPMSWLSSDTTEVQKYKQDKLNGFIFTNNGFNTLFQLMHNATKKGWQNKIRHDLPILIASGNQDPVGNFGKGPAIVAKQLDDANFTDVTLILFDQMRHELLNEKKRSYVFAELLGWLEDKRDVRYVD